MISVQIEKISEHTSLYDGSNIVFKMFEIILSNNQGFIKAHNFIIFPKCESLSRLEIRDGEYKFEDDHIEVMESFISLLYGREIQMSFERLLKLYRHASSLSYHNLDTIKEIIYNNIENLSYSSSENQMSIFLETLNEPGLDRTEIISNSKLAQLKRISMMTSDSEILQLIIQETMKRYSEDTTSAMKHFDEEKLKIIGKYETQIHKLNAEKQNSLTDLFK